MLMYFMALQDSQSYLTKEKEANIPRIITLRKWYTINTTCDFVDLLIPLIQPLLFSAEDIG